MCFFYEIRPVLISYNFLYFPTNMPSCGPAKNKIPSKHHRATLHRKRRGWRDAIRNGINKNNNKNNKERVAEKDISWE